MLIRANERSKKCSNELHSAFERALIFIDAQTLRILITMGHLDNTERVVEARLTALGRQRLAEGDGLEITQFALSDDEVDYRLWQNNVPQQDAGAIIENLPTYEAFTDETQSMRYKLVSLEPNSDEIPQIDIDSDLLVINLDEQNQFSNGNQVDIDPTTTLDGQETGLDSTLGYTAILQDRTIADLQAAPDSDVEEDSATIPALYGEKQDIGGSQTSSVVANAFQLGWNAPNISNDQETTLTIIGNETGLSLDITVNVIGE